MSLWQRPLKRLQAIAEHRTYRFRLNSLKGFVSLFLVGTVLSVALPPAPVEELGVILPLKPLLLVLWLQAKRMLN